MKPPQRYYYRRSRDIGWGTHPTLELIATIIVVVAVIVTILVFLLVYHDLPLRTGEPTTIFGGTALVP